ncbi:hypothetical protein ADL02_26640 [Streptomyces sp. NRRL WC-3723]|nr:hypothetical protein ADL02_26640 [Streptomyces sp. NRRL WC-3723]
MTTTTAVRAAARVADAVKVHVSGKSTLMHRAAGLDTLTSGAACIGVTGLDTLVDLVGLRDRLHHSPSEPGPPGPRTAPRTPAAWSPSPSGTG